MDFRNMLMVVSLLLSVMIGLLIARSSSHPGGGNAVETSNQPPLIGLSLDTLKEARWIQDRDIFIKTAGELGVRLNVNTANSDDSQQARDVQSLVASMCNCLVIVPHDGTAMKSSVDLAKKQGIPVIAYDRLIRNCDIDLYISFDNVAVGKQQAQYLVDHLPTPGHGSIVRIYGSKTDNNAKMFKEGQDELLNPLIARGDIKVVFENWADDWKPENAHLIARSAVSNGVPFDAVLASNDGTALGAIKALEEANLAGKILVTGQDADLANCQNIVKGIQAMTVYKPVKQLAALAARTAVDMARGKKITSSSTINNDQKDVPAVLMDTVAVTKDNMQQTVIKDGFHTYDEVYGVLPPEQRPPRVGN